MNTKELRNKSESELHQDLHDSLKEWFNLRMQKVSGQNVLPHLFSKVKRQIARIKTVLSEKGQAV